MEELLKNLNSAHTEAVTNYSGPALVIAGAGSGKTRVLTYRIAWMLKQGIRPSGILALTFTNKAANEMKERIAALVGYDLARQLWMGTFHSVFARILRFEAASIGYPADYTIYDTIDSKSLLKTIIKELKLDDKLYKPNEILGRISSAKNNLITPEAYAGNTQIQATDRSMKKPQITDIYTRYAARCKKAGAMDFDDLLLNTNILLRDHPQVLQKYSGSFSHILVDEYQDTNYSQYLIIKKLSQEHRNICVVGDDAQSIYSFRGARIENILKFQSDYPKTQLYKLEQNYRSTKYIVDAANSLISKNSKQIKKTIFSKNDLGEKIEVHRVKEDKDEGYLVANIIKDNSLTEQLKFLDFAILYRTNAQSRIFEESLRRLNIPYKIYGGISFFQRKEIKDILAYFKLVVNPHDDEALKRVINFPLRGIGKTSISKMEELAIANNFSLWEVLNAGTQLQKFFNTGTLKKLFGFLNLIRGFQEKAKEMEAFDLAYTIASSTGIMKELVADKSPEGISRYENLEELLNGIKDFTESAENEGGNTLSHYLQTVSLYTDADTENAEDKNKVTLMTAHSAKGLEFKQVFIVGMEKNLFPSFMSVDTPDGLEEERRLFYVALTRAEKRAYITYARKRYKWGLLTDCEPSPFITEIDEKYLILPENFGMPGIPAGITEETHKRRPGGIHKSSQPSSGITGKKLKKISESVSSSPVNPSPHNQIFVGSKVKHDRFGLGVVDVIEGSFPNDKATVHFEKHGKKQLLLKFAKLEVME